MERVISLGWLGIIFGLVVSVQAQTGGTTPGIITSFNVDITDDQGALLTDRLNVGDTVFIVLKPPVKKDDWVRISRSPNDTVGIGWIEKKNVRPITQFRDAQQISGGEKQTIGEPFSPELSIPMVPENPPIPLVGTPATKPMDAFGDQGLGVESDELDLLMNEGLGSAEETGLLEIGTEGSVAPSKGTYKKVAVIPFIFSDSSDRSVADSLWKSFSTTLRNDGSFQDWTDRISKQKVDSTNPQQLLKLAGDQQLDGLFVGSLSPLVGTNRLLEIKFFGQKDQAFVFEKVTQIPVKGSSQKALENLVDEAVRFLTGRSK